GCVHTRTNSVAEYIAVGNYPDGVAITSDGTRAYVTNGADNSVSVIDTASNAVLATIPVRRFPEAVAIVPSALAPRSKDDCKHGGYLAFGPPAGPFKNQGQCVSYVEHQQHDRP